NRVRRSRRVMIMTKIHEGVGVRIAHAPTPLPTSSGTTARRAPVRGALIAALAAVVLAGCTSPHPAPIVRREPASPAKSAVPPPAAPVAIEPSTEVPPPVDGPIVTPVPTVPVPSASAGSQQPGAPGSVARPLSPTAPVI